MKKITLALITALGMTLPTFGQVTTVVEAPLYDGSYSSLSVPSGSSSVYYHRTCWLVTQAELQGLALTNSVITAFGLQFIQGVDVATAGQFTVYMENTSDNTYLKGTSWSTLLTGMNTNYVGTLNLPVTPGFSAVTLPLTTNFTYTGGGIYVAMDWASTSPNASQLAFGYCNTTVLSTTGGVRGFAGSAGPAPTTLSTTAFRPAMLWSAANTATNEASIEFFQPLGQVSKAAGLAQIIEADVQNNSAVALTSLSVGLAVTGANTFANTQVIASLAPGAVQTVTFAAFTATNSGANNIIVSLLPDQKNNNNSMSMTQSVTCGVIGVVPAAPTTSYTSNGYTTNGNIFAFKYTTGAANSTVTSVNCLVPSVSGAGNAGNQVFPVLCDATGAIIAQGNPVTLAANNMDVFFPFTFNTPEALTPNTDYFFGLGCSTTTNFPIGAPLNSANLLGQYRIPLAGGTPTQIAVLNLALSANVLFNNLTLTSSATKTNVCKNEKYTLTATGANTYTWSNGANTSTIAPTLSVTAGFNVVGTSTTNGCPTNKAFITFSVAACNGLVDNIGENAVRVMPNPAIAGKTTISNLSGVNTIMVFNTLGQVVINRTVSTETESIDLSNFPSGNYLVRITDSNNDTRVVKLVNQN